MYFDPLYFIFMIPGLLLSLAASAFFLRQALKGMEAKLNLSS